MLLLFFVCLFFFGSSLPLFFDKQKMPFHPARTRIHLVDLFRLRLVHQREIRSADLVPNNKKKKVLMAIKPVRKEKNNSAAGK